MKNKVILSFVLFPVVLAQDALALSNQDLCGTKKAEAVALQIRALSDPAETATKTVFKRDISGIQQLDGDYEVTLKNTKAVVKIRLSQSCQVLRYIFQ